MRQRPRDKTMLLLMTNLCFFLHECEAEMCFEIFLLCLCTSNLFIGLKYFNVIYTIPPKFESYAIKVAFFFNKYLIFQYKQSGMVIKKNKSKAALFKQGVLFFSIFLFVVCLHTIKAIITSIERAKPKKVCVCYTIIKLSNRLK